MERNTSLNHRITSAKKNEFNFCFKKVQTELLKEGITITKEDFLEAVIELAGNSERQLIKIMKFDFQNK